MYIKSCPVQFSVITKSTKAVLPKNAKVYKIACFSNLYICLQMVGNPFFSFRLKRSQIAPTQTAAETQMCDVIINYYIVPMCECVEIAVACDEN